MDAGTAADYALLDELAVPYIAGTGERVLAYLERLRGGLAGYHSLQTASRALRAGECEEFVVAALLHDIGDDLAPENHSELGAAVLRLYVARHTRWVGCSTACSRRTTTSTRLAWTRAPGTGTAGILRSRRPPVAFCYHRSVTRASTTTQQAADAILFAARPRQGCWSEHDYLWLTDRCNRLIEFTDGFIEELPVPTDTHQSVLMFLYRLFDRRVRAEGGVVLVAPLRLRIQDGRFREPDLMLLGDASDARRQDRYWLGADLVVEVVSPDDPDRDYREKRADYAAVGIPEYWIVDPRDPSITVLALDGDRYVDKGLFRPGEVAASATLDGLAVAVAEFFEAGPSR